MVVVAPLVSDPPDVGLVNVIDWAVAAATRVASTAKNFIGEELERSQRVEMKTDEQISRAFIRGAVGR